MATAAATAVTAPHTADVFNTVASMMWSPDEYGMKLLAGNETAMKSS
jgi:hypothetical protein